MPVSEEGMRKLLKLLAEDGSEQDVELALRRLMRAADERDKPKGDLAQQAAQVTSAYQFFSDKHNFSPGQLVRWKSGMKNRKRPYENQPAIVLEALSEPVFDTDIRDSSAATPYFREPLDLLLGFIDSDGDFLVFHFDSRRFEPFTEKPKV